MIKIVSCIDYFSIIENINAENSTAINYSDAELLLSMILFNDEKVTVW